MDRQDTLKRIIAFKEAIDLMDCVKFLKFGCPQEIDRLKAIEQTAMKENDTPTKIKVAMRRLDLFELRHIASSLFQNRVGNNVHILTSKIWLSHGNQSRAVSYKLFDLINNNINPNASNSIHKN